MKSKIIVFIVAFLLLPLFYNFAQESPTSIESICGEDDRTVTNNKAVGRIWVDSEFYPRGTAFIISNGKLVTAGHVGGYVYYNSNDCYVEFNVKPSDINGYPTPSDEEDRYKINKASITWDNNNDGDDWAVFQVYPNSVTGLMPIDEGAQNSFLNIQQTINLQTIRITGCNKPNSLKELGL
jgi:hypothetical protein